MNNSYFERCNEYVSKREIFSDFIKNVNDIDVKYKICMSDTCFNAIYPLVNCLNYNALLYMAPQIAQNWVSFRIVPHILLFDFFIKYGKNINRMVDSFISEVYEIAHSIDATVSRENLRRDILGKLRICCYATVSKLRMLMKTDCYHCFIETANEYKYKSNVHEMSYFNGLESLLARLKPNVNCLSFGVNSKTIGSIDKTAHRLGADYVLPVDGDRGYIFLIKNGNNVNAACVLQVVKTFSTNDFYVTPNIVLTNINIDHCFELYSRIFSKDALKILDNYSKVPNVASSILYIVLCYNLLTMFNLQGNLDLNRVKANLGNTLQLNMVLDELFAIKKPFLSLGEISKFTTGTLGNFPNIDSVSSKNRDCSLLLQDCVANASLEQEGTSYLEATGQRTITFYDKQREIIDLINGVKPTNKFELAITVNELLRLQNFGMINLTFNNEGKCIFSLNNLATLIYPLRYKLYTRFMEKAEDAFRIWGDDHMFKCLKAFSVDHPDICNSNDCDLLISLTKKLHSAGILWKDLAINYNHFVLESESLCDRTPGTSDEDFLIVSMIAFDAKANENSEAFVKYLRK